VNLPTTMKVTVADTAGLEGDAVKYMAVVLNRAKGWLAEAQSIEEVRHARAVAVGYESVLREKELAFDAQLAATELVRRCERRLGELVRQGQHDGTVARRGQHPDTTHGGELVGVAQAMGVSPNDNKSIADRYAFASASADEFEEALDAARDEGNLSRANVARKVKGKAPKPERSDWHRKRRRIDSNRVLRTLADTLDSASTGLELMERDDVDPAVAEECIASIDQSIRKIRSHLRRVK
jgi:hypothetical protein